jgi:hypothetical protein
MNKYTGISLVIISVVIAACCAYQFIIRPIQRDNKLNVCLDSMWSLYGNNDELYKSKTENCYKEFKR